MGDLDDDDRFLCFLFLDIIYFMWLDSGSILYRISCFAEVLRVALAVDLVHVVMSQQEEVKKLIHKYKIIKKKKKKWVSPSWGTATTLKMCRSPVLLLSPKFLSFLLSVRCWSLRLLTWYESFFLSQYNCDLKTWSNAANAYYYYYRFSL